MTGIVMAVKCHYCAKFHNPRQTRLLSCRVQMCEQCEEWHLAALKMIAGDPPKGCQVCGLSYRELELIVGSKVRFVAVPKDGIYQVLCGACADGYVVLRRDLVQDTAFAARAGMN